MNQELPDTPEDEELALSSLVYALLEEKYGKNGQNPKPYHNLEHTKRVVAAAQKIAREMGLDQKKIERISIAALCHDLEQAAGSGESERLSAEWAVEEMRKRGYSEEDCSDVYEMILGTITSLQNDTLTQAASASNNVGARIVADADLSTLGEATDIYMTSFNNLVEEQTGAKLESFSRPEIAKMALQQVRILKNHQFLTEEANTLFANKNDNIDAARSRAIRLVPPDE